MAKQTTKPLAAAVGAAFLASVAVAPMAMASDNPFQASELTSGYNNMSSKLAEGGCGEGKCGEGKCGDKDKEKEKDKDGKCGEGKCGEDKEKGKEEGKCGEGKCGEDKEKDKDEDKDEDKGE